MKNARRFAALTCLFLALAAGFTTGCKDAEKKPDDEAWKKELQKLNEFTKKERSGK